jgi:indole-3-glycerol phosphate synthase
LSVLTDFNSFQGKKSYIAEAKASSSIPILRKDFLYDPYQVLETRAIGADCILVIMATVSDQQAKELEDCANFWGMDVLIEVHDESELERALQLNSKFIGINNRNLKTFNIRLETTEELVLKIPKDYLIVSESGLTNKNDLIRMVQANVRSFLIGESLMRQNDIKSAIEGLLD